MGEVTRKRKTTSEPKDLTKAVLEKDYIVPEDSCFGTMHSLTDPECRYCHLKEICTVLTGNTVKPVKKKTYLDELDWENVPWDTYKKALQTNDINLQDFLDKVAELSKCLDKKTVRIKVNKFIRENGFKIDEGYITI